MIGDLRPCRSADYNYAFLILSLLRLLGELRQLRIHVIPGLRAGRVEIHARLEAARIVQTAGGDRDDRRHSRGLAEQARAAIGTEAATRRVAAIGATVVILNLAGNL